jgi:hypothetical protein
MKRIKVKRKRKKKEEQIEEKVNNLYLDILSKKY